MYLYSWGQLTRMFSLQSSKEPYTSFQKRLVDFLFALLIDTKFDLQGSKEQGATSCLCSFAQVASEPINLLSQDILIAFQKELIFGIPKPPSLTAILLVVSSTTLGFPSRMKNLSSDSRILKCAMLKLGITATM